LRPPAGFPCPCLVKTRKNKGNIFRTARGAGDRLYIWDYVVPDEPHRAWVRRQGTKNRLLPPAFFPTGALLFEKMFEEKMFEKTFLKKIKKVLAFWEMQQYNYDS